MDGLSSLTAIYYKEPEAFVKILRDSKNLKWEEQEDEQPEEYVDSTGGKMGTYQAQAANQDYSVPANQGGIDLLGDDDGPQPAQGAPAEQNTPFEDGADLLGGNAAPPQPQVQVNNIKIPMSTVLNETVNGVKNQRSGLKIQAAVQREGNQIVMYLEIENKTAEPVTNLAVKFDANSYKLQPINVALDLQGVLYF